MASEETVEADSISDRILTAEYKDGQLQIVEVIPLDRHGEEVSNQQSAASSSEQDDQPRYMQVLDNKRLLQLDLLNLALLKCQDGESSYRLVSSKASESDGETDTTITCVLQSSDGEEVENESYVMVDGEEGPVVYLQSSAAKRNEEVTEQATAEKPLHQPTPVEIIERAKALQRARANNAQPATKRRAKKRKGSLPPPHELLASPNFKLYLYSCRACDFKCNAVKELTQHRQSEHCSGGKIRARAAAAMQCPHCPYRAPLYSQLESHIREKHKNVSDITSKSSVPKIHHCSKCSFQSSSHSQIIKHVCANHPTRQDEHDNEQDEESLTIFTNDLFMNTIDAESADILVCGACGFESQNRQDFTNHVIREHGTNSC